MNTISISILKRKIVITAASFGASAVILGAFGAHALKAYLDVNQIATYQTAIDYHFIHSLALLGLACLPLRTTESIRFIRWTFRFFVLGILFFSGSLYLISCKNLLQVDAFMFIIGPLTPLGGLFFILGWFTTILYAKFEFQDA